MIKRNGEIRLVGVDRLVATCDSQMLINEPILLYGTVKKVLLRNAEDDATIHNKTMLTTCVGFRL